MPRDLLAQQPRDLLADQPRDLLAGMMPGYGAAAEGAPVPGGDYEAGLQGIMQTPYTQPLPEAVGAIDELVSPTIQGTLPGSGLVAPGNIDLNNRPKIYNPDGTISTELSFSFNDGQNEVLIPSIVNGRVLSQEQAIQHYFNTGDHLGKFDSIEAANAAAEQTHNRKQPQQDETTIGGALIEGIKNIARGRLGAIQGVLEAGGRDQFRTVYEQAGWDQATLDKIETEVDKDDPILPAVRRAVDSELLKPDEAQAGSDSLLHQVVQAAPDYAAMIASALVHPGFAAATISSQLLGSSYLENLESSGDREASFTGALISTAGQLPLEAIGIGKVTKLFTKSLNGLAKRALASGEVSLVEGVTEALQRLPEVAGSLYAQNPNATLEEFAQKFADRMPHTLREAWQAGQVGAILGLVGGGVVASTRPLGASPKELGLSQSPQPAAEAPVAEPPAALQPQSPPIPGEAPAPGPEATATALSPEAGVSPGLPSVTAPQKKVAPPVVKAVSPEEFARLSIEQGDMIRTPGLALAGKVVGEGTIGKGIPAWRVDAGPQKGETLIPKDQAELWQKPGFEAVQGVSSLEEAEARLDQRVDENIGEVVPPVGLSVKQVVAPVAPERASTYQFKDPETEERFQAARGVKRESLAAKTKAVLTSIKNKATREFEHLPRGAEFAPMRSDLLRMGKARGVAEGTATKYIQGITTGLNSASFEIFRRKVILDDMAAELESNPDTDLAFGFTPETLGDELASLNAQVAAMPEVARALEDRKALWSALPETYIAAMKDIGFNVDNLTKKDYFRRQILAWQQVDRIVQGAGSRARTPAGRSHLKKRTGKGGQDYNTDYLQAEHQVVSQMLHDMEVARLLKNTRENYDISDTLKREAKGEGLEDWRGLIPEGYVEWQPREGHAFYLADSIPAKLAEEVATGQLETILGKSLAGQLRKVLAMGPRRTAYVISQEVADTLNNISQSKSHNFMGEASRKLLRSWKRWTLISPRRYFKYNLRNLTGDAEAMFVGNPRAFLKVPQATGELFDVYYGKKALTPEMKEWFSRGGTLGNLQVQEMGAISGLSTFKKLMDKKDAGKKNLNVWKKYWELARISTDMREGILRYAAYLDYLGQMKKSPDGRPKNFGASRPEEVMALKDIHDRAYWLSNELLGAYDRVSVAGQGMREHLYPFWSWKEVNFKRYVGLFKNATEDRKLAGAVGRKVLGKAANPITYIRVGRFVIMASAFWGGLQAYNHLFWPEEEKELPAEVRNRTHIVLGRDSDGKVMYFSRLGTLGDFLEWFGLDAAPQHFQAWANGVASVADIAKHIAEAPLKMLIQGATPFFKTPAEVITRRNLFPDPLNPGTIRDRGLHIARSLGLENEYKALMGVPGEPYAETLPKAFIYKSDPFEAGYRDILSAKREFLEKEGKGSEGFWITPRGNALYYLKLAWRYGQKKEAAKYYQEYRALGGTDKGMRRSLETMNPLYGLDPVETVKFLDGLDDSQKNALVRAIAFYNYTLLGGQKVPKKKAFKGE